MFSVKLSFCSKLIALQSAFVLLKLSVFIYTSSAHIICNCKLFTFTLHCVFAATLLCASNCAILFTIVFCILCYFAVSVALVSCLTAYKYVLAFSICIVKHKMHFFIKKMLCCLAAFLARCSACCVLS